MRQIRPLAVAGLILAIGLCAEPSQGSDPFKTVEDSTPQEVVGGMSHKIVRGVSNFALGWWELPKQVYQTFREEGVTMGLTVGPLKGVGMTLVRTLSGAGEVLTFPFPFPGFYDPYFEPEYAWQKERKVDSPGAPPLNSDGAVTAPTSGAGSSQTQP
ncbi:exosortase system-associated protein, TIGR04073 family [Geobacter sp. AOG2]|uniref:exosortase system-associated protein, TIGR04073 family n=1 Tax=Geobacter sp. AOG2 TaxID=1566347 RepID=UPI001CC40C21|nr:exosortase system-associated protein, TIGR04073 family [Geobacter sp. AOG2]GFE59414.1 hypothetical protein AOG2_00020 [Geobacter sp. AOG2]